MSACRALEMREARKRGKSRKTWMDCVPEDMKRQG